jgi:hypothetical protein
MPVLILLLALVFAVSAAHASPGTATLSTLGNQPMTFELGATSATTIEAMRLTTTTLTVSGTVSATRFSGDGSALTNLATSAPTDRITSGTNSIIVNSAMNTISLTTNGNAIGYFGVYGLQVGNGVTTAGGISFMGPTTGWQEVSFQRPGATRGYIAYSQPSETMYLRTNGANNRLVITSSSMGVMTDIPSATLHVAGTALTTSWTGINFGNAANVVPTAPLEVSGTVSATALTVSSRTSVIGVSGTAGLIKFARGVDGSPQASIGYASAANSINFASSNGGGLGYFSWNLNLNSLGGSTEVMKLDNDGHLIIGAASATSTIGFKRGSDGTETGTIGFVSPTDPKNFTFRNNTGQGYFAWMLNPTTNGQEVMRLTPYGQLSIGISPTTMGATSVGVQVSGTVSATNLTIAGTAQLGVYAAEPVSCSTPYKGMLAMSTTGGLCFCNGASWNKIEAPTTTCAW